MKQSGTKQWSDSGIPDIATRAERSEARGTPKLGGKYDETTNWMSATREGNTAHVDHANVLYQIPAKEKASPVVFLHGYGQTRTGWMTTPDGVSSGRQTGPPSKEFLNMKKSFSSILIFTLAALGIMLFGNSCASSKPAAKNVSSQSQNKAAFSSSKKDYASKSDLVFALGNDVSQWFTGGEVYLNNLIKKDSVYNFPTSNTVTFAPGARSAWHVHGEHKSWKRRRCVGRAAF